MLQIYISTFDKPVMKIRNGIPIEVGAAGREHFHYPLHDDTGDHISSENAYFGELTGLYWIWKNAVYKEDDLIGFGHYNKALRITGRLRRQLEEEKELWITAAPVKIRPHSIAREVKALREILRAGYPEYYETWQRLYLEDGSGRSASCRYANLFLTRGRELNAYCEFLFAVLFELRAAVGEGSADRYHRRYCAFLGERLLSVYLETRRKPAAEAPVRQAQWYIEPGRRIAHALGISGNGPAAAVLKDRIRYRSSYREDLRGRGAPAHCEDRRACDTPARMEDCRALRDGREK